MTEPQAGCSMPTTTGQEAGPSKKKARRSSSSRPAETASFIHYGPVACTSASAALVQAYLATDTSSTGGVAQPSNGSSVSSISSSSNGGRGGNDSGGSGSSGSCSSGNNGPNSSNSSTQRSKSDRSRFLHMSESTFDLAKYRFGGKTKPVTLAHSTAKGAAGGGGGGGGSSNSSKGARVSFGQGTKILATKEALHATLHCRCVFVLLRESASCDSSPGKTSSSSSKAAPLPPQNGGEGVDTAHLVALSPDDLFCALSVDSFPLRVSAEADVIGGSSSSSTTTTRNRRRGQQQQAPVAAGPLPRAFEIVDGPAVIHRPVARHGEPWRGLEIFRSEGIAGAWRGRRVPTPVGGGRDDDGGDGGGDGRLGRILVGGSGDRVGSAFRLDLSAANAAADGDHDLEDAAPPLSQEPTVAAAAGAARLKKRAAGVGNNGLIVCPSSALPAAARRDAAGSFCRGWGSSVSGIPNGYDGLEAAVVTLPASVSAAAAAAAAAVADGEAQDLPPSPPRPPPQWASLSIDREGKASLSPWRGLPFESKKHLTCLCRAPDLDAGMVELAAGGGGLVLKSPPPTLYVGMVAGDGRNQAGTADEGEGRAVAMGRGGALLELQGGTLSCSRLLPAPPSAVMTAAVDDAQGVLVVLLADPAGTALLLARDGSDFPVVEQHRGISAAFTGDFLGNGREQVALLRSPPTGPAGDGGGGGTGRAGKRGATGATKAGAGGWEQLPLKALVKRALVTDGSFVWASQRRDDTPAAPAAPAGGGISTNRGAGAGVAAAATARARTSRGPPKGKKRQRSGELEDGEDATENAGTSVDRSPATGARPGKSKNKDGDDGHRLSRLSSVVGVLRRRVQAEEARLLRLRQARRGKAAALEAAKLALVSHVGGAAAATGAGLGAGGETSAENGGEDRPGTASPPASLSVRAFTDGLVSPSSRGGGGGGGGGSGSGGGVSATPTPGLRGADRRVAGEARPQCAPLRCTVSRARFHAPSRTLCLDACITNPSPWSREPGGAADPQAAEEETGPPSTVADVSLAFASASGRLTTRSAVCPRLRPGEAATVRACCEVPFALLAGCGGGGVGGGSSGATPREPASLFASCAWSLCPSAGSNGEVGAAPTAGGAREGSSNNIRSPSRSLIFSRILVSPQDMLGMGGALSSTARTPVAKVGQEPSSRSATAGGGGGVGRKKETAASTSSGDGSTAKRHLGLFDVGTPLDLLLRSSSGSASAAGLAALPQAVRSLSDVAALPEPWAGGAAVRVESCSERAAECTLLAGDPASAPAVLLAVAAGALPDGVQASANHASEQGLALVAAAAAALRDEMAALEAVARERGRADGGAAARGGAGAGGLGGGGVGAGKTTEGLAAALERYEAAQRKSDVLAARLAGRVVAARGAEGFA